MGFRVLSNWEKRFWGFGEGEDEEDEALMDDDKKGGEEKW